MLEEQLDIERERFNSLLEKFTEAEVFNEYVKPPEDKDAPKMEVRLGKSWGHQRLRLAKKSYNEYAAELKKAKDAEKEAEG